jgi:hypothetical protein
MRLFIPGLILYGGLWKIAAFVFSTAKTQPIPDDRFNVAYMTAGYITKGHGLKRRLK